MKKRLPVKVQHHLTKRVNDKAKELLGDDYYKKYFEGEGSYDLYIVDQCRGTTDYTRRTVTVPHWCIKNPKLATDTMVDIISKVPQEYISEYWVYYLAHELAHALAFDKYKKRNHCPVFMEEFKKICPKHLQVFELGYKPRNAKAAGISI